MHLQNIFHLDIKPENLVRGGAPPIEHPTEFTQSQTDSAPPLDIVPPMNQSRLPQLIDGDGTPSRPLKTLLIEFGCSVCRDDLDAQGRKEGLAGSPGYGRHGGHRRTTNTYVGPFATNFIHVAP